jgi:cobalt-zinc-cadmium efflux system membrane fusion protein
VKRDKMKRFTGLLSILSMTLLLDAKIIELSSQELKDWQIKTALAKKINTLPLGLFMAEVVTPPQLLYSVALPFEAQVKKLNVANYDNVKKGELLAMVTGHDWITIQQQFIQDSIELKHHQHVAERKNRLCNEGIIPKKECNAANAEFKADKIKFATAKALLRGYGADEQIINNLFNNLEISQTIPVRSKFSGKLLELNVRVGKSTQPSESLFVIQKEGALWLEAELLIKNARQLKDGQEVNLNFSDATFKSKVLLHAPQINVENQTQKVRFSLPNRRTFVTGLRDMLKISKNYMALKIPKKSVISLGGAEVVFVTKEKGFEPIAIKILGEENNNYFVEMNLALEKPIVQTSVAILKSIMESEDE